MGDGDDLNVVQALAKNDRKWIAVEDQSLCSVKVWSEKTRVSADSIKGWDQFFVKPIRSLKALAEIPRVSRFNLGLGQMMVRERFHLRRRARASGDKLFSILPMTSSPGISSTAPESISSRRRLISSPQAASISASLACSSSETLS